MEQDLKRPGEELARIAAILAAGAIGRMSVQSDKVVPEIVKAWISIFNELKKEHLL